MEGNAPATGSLLIAHPLLKDPNFHQTVIFPASHDSGEMPLEVIEYFPALPLTGHHVPPFFLHSSNFPL